MEKITLVIIIGIMGLGLIFALAYIGYDKIPDFKNKYQVEGYQAGYEEALRDLHAIVMDCQTIPLTIDNQTVTLIAGECLQRE